MREISMPIAILAGGIANRLRPLTQGLPKALIEIEGEPFISLQLKLLKNNGFRRVVICAGHLGEMIESAIGQGQRFGLEITYSFDAPHLLGTGGALKKALPFLDDSFFVLYGDSYLSCDYGHIESVFRASSKLALMTVFPNKGNWDTSNVEFENGRIIAYSKKNRAPRMCHIDYGLGAFRKAAFAFVPEETAYDLADLYATLLAKGYLAGEEISDRFYEIGSFSGLNELRSLFRAGLLP
jgi:NDP-sugar pyrophosphorylase family protein